jgi:diaminohydroxyphosphoribosylaminopyrimidine deaminase/5-amino-6-(5-phosphoribosylamino)uracil reductase
VIPDEKYMQRAIELAKLGVGSVSPNPQVGCVIVHNNIIIGEGWHQKFGGPHAEIHALNSVTNKWLLKESTFYVTLEPCSHFGKTPPCANALIEHGIKQVVIGITDPNPLVSGKGIKLLNDAGINVITDLLKNECADLNKRYITYINQKRPYVILKWAQTNDGFIAPDKNELSDTEFEKQKQISAATVQKITHRWRTQEDAFMVGTNTALIDNPKLSARHWQGRNPKRVVLDLNNRLSKSLCLFDGTQPTFVFVYEENQTESTYNMTYIPITRKKDLVPQILTELYKQQIQSLVIEGGAQILQTFIDSNVWDEAIIIKAPHQLTQGVKAPTLVGKTKESFLIENNIISRINNQ